MAKGGYIGINNTAKKIKKGYIGVPTQKDALKFLEYIESTGTQYIDTGWKFGTVNYPNVSLEADVVITATSGTRITGVGAYTSFYYGVGVFGNGWACGNGHGDVNVSNSSYTIGARVKINYSLQTPLFTVEDQSNGNIIANSSFTPQTPQHSAVPFLLSAFKQSDTGAITPHAERIYSFKIFENENLVRDFVPCQNASGEIGMYDNVHDVFYPNAGTGTFIAGSVIEEVGGETVEVARKIKKAYMGVGGVARPCWGSGISYYGTIAPLSVARYLLASAPVSQYLIFAGGYDDNTELTSALDIYSDNLIKLSSGDLPITVAEMCGSYNENYALFGGGNTPSATPGSYTVYAYDGQLSRTTAPDLALRVQGAVGCNLGEYALIAAGSYRVKVFAVNAYNNNLVKSRPSDLSAGGRELGAAASNSYAIFAGNSLYNDGNLAEAYSSNLVKTNISPLSIKRAGPAGAVVGNYYLFAGGKTNISSTALDTPTDSVEVYNNNLVRLTPVLMSSASCRMAHTEINGFAIFAGGGKELRGTYPTYDNVEIFDDNLQRTNLKLSKSRTDLSGGTVGKYALFSGGGYRDSSRNLVTVNTVDTYIS